ncbi:putative membrane protein [Paucimonas lemoignei]|uniref:Putative membrane protein n=1 Tax=Paucimonas lemoignei TaxID=29443 RepID=A0A4R3HRL3_PAULE|nr:hypothetical protein [Paucimonas lemoignei]TCS35558.1 putative membrane protein [Paucimonas lemoignei]
MPVLVTLLYPLLVWLGHGEVEPRLLAGVLVLAAVLRIFAKGSDKAGFWWLLGALLLAAMTFWKNAWMPLKLYPVLVSAVMLGVFGYSLISPPSLIERLARMQDPDLPPYAVSYTYRVTQAWCVFFLINGAIALGTALWASPAVWSLYNGVISYVLMGCLFGGEYLVRLRVKRNNG